MAAGDEEDDLRAVALRNAQSILLARRRAEHDLEHAKDALERKIAELDRSLAAMHATFEATTDGILVIDDAGRVSNYNRRFVEMWDVPDEVLASAERLRMVAHTASFFEAPAAFEARIDEIRNASSAESFDVLELADGRVYERFSQTQFVNGVPVGRVWTFRDVTELRRLLASERAARTHAENMSSMKDEFLATLSHELRTPLSAILGWTQVLRRKACSPEELQRALDVIERNARVQTQLIEDLLDMSRITSGKVRLDIQPVAPLTFIEAALETVRPAADAKAIRLEKLLDPEAGPVHGDPGRLQQVVWNLLSNAIKFTPKGGKVQVVLERVNSHIEISVADTGMGIAPEFLGHVFERFRQADASTTRSFGGLGLGLSIVKHLLELHGGSIHATSPGEGQGATFTIHLPLTAVRRSADSERQHPRTPSTVPRDYRVAELSGLRIVVVDDEPDARELLQHVLVECGAEVFAAGSAAEALVMLGREKPDLLVTDIGMPVTDGFDLLKLARTQGFRMPAIALTAFARSEDRTRALRAGFLVHVSKPVEPLELVATVASVTGRAEGVA